CCHAHPAALPSRPTRRSSDLGRHRGGTGDGGLLHHRGVRRGHCAGGGMSGKKAPQRSQRERLLGRQRPTLPYRLLVDPDGVADARVELAAAQAELRQAQMRKAAASTVRAAEAKVRRAEAKVDACYETIMLRAVSPVRMEQLAAEHPATEEQ